MLSCVSRPNVFVIETYTILWYNATNFKHIFNMESCMDRTLNEKLDILFDDARTRRALFWMILALGIFARAFRFGLVPGGINQDEAFAGYEAWALLNYGIDTAGYHNPVYLVAWGSGMNALETYLMMPFIALFGLKVWVIRLPQLIVSCLSLWVVYLLVRRTVNERAGLMAMFMLAICPWHIIMSRWGLESNLAPGFLLFGLYFFVCALDKPRYMLLSALMYGLSLYTYATIWVYVPAMLLVQLIYCMASKRLRFDKWLCLSGVLLAALAVPLLLFLAVNYGYIDEIRTPLFSIPRLLYMRSSEISLDGKRAKLKLLWKIFIEQNDGEIWNSPMRFGLFYYISMPFAILGIFFCIRQVIACVKRHEFCPEALLLVQFFMCLPQCVLVSANVTRINILFIPLIVFIALGGYFLSTLSHRCVLAGITAVYAALFVGFECYYFTEYDRDIRVNFSYGLEDALDVAVEKADTVYIGQNGAYYTKVLFYAEEPVDEFRSTVQYLDYPAAFLQAQSFGRFRFYPDLYSPEDDAAYVMTADSDYSMLLERGFTVEYHGAYIVAYKEPTS